MKTLPFLVLPIVLMVSLGGCSLSEKYAANNSAGRSWVEAGKTGTARSNFEGVYYSPEWGTVTLNQENGKLAGSLGHFRVSGLVSGRNARLLLVDDQWVEFTMLLRRVSYEKLTGSYSGSVPYSEAHSKPVTLLRIDICWRGAYSSLCGGLDGWLLGDRRGAGRTVSPQQQGGGSLVVRSI